MHRSATLALVGFGTVVLIIAAAAATLAGLGWLGPSSMITAREAIAAAAPVVHQHGSSYGSLEASLAPAGGLQRDSEGRPLGPVPGARCSGFGVGRLTGRPFQVCLPRQVWVVHVQGNPGVPALTTRDDLYVFVDAHTGQVISTMESGPL